MVILYGIQNCDSVKKAKRWLDGKAHDYRFHDFRLDGLQAALLEDWLQRVDYVQLLNTRSRTWKQLSATERSAIDGDKALQLMQQYPTLIKRPVLDSGGELLVGFSEQRYADYF